MSEEYYEKQLFETDSGEVYFCNQFGKLFRLDFQDDNDNLEEVEDLIVDYEVISLEAKELRDELKKSAKEHGIELGETRKDMFDTWRERKNLKDELTIDITSEEFVKRNLKNIKKRYDNILKRINEEEWLDESHEIFIEEMNIDKEVISTLEEHEENKKSRYFLETKPIYNLEC